MMTKTNTSTVRTGSYETDYEATYETDHDITTAEADSLIASKYHMFPITRDETPSPRPLDTRNEKKRHAMPSPPPTTHRPPASIHDTDTARQPTKTS